MARQCRNAGVQWPTEILRCRRCLHICLHIVPSFEHECDLTLCSCHAIDKVLPFMWALPIQCPTNAYSNRFVSFRISVCLLSMVNRIEWQPIIGVLFITLSCLFILLSSPISHVSHWPRITEKCMLLYRIDCISFNFMLLKNTQTEFNALQLDRRYPVSALLCVMWVVCN